MMAPGKRVADHLDGPDLVLHVRPDLGPGGRASRLGPRRARAVGGQRPGQCAEQAIEPRLRVRRYPHPRRKAGELRRVDVDAHQLLGEHKTAIGIHVVVRRPEFGAGGDHQIGSRHQRAHRFQARAGGNGERMAVKEPAAVAGGDDRSREPFGQAAQGALRMSGTAAGKDQRSLGRCGKGCRGSDCILIRRCRRRPGWQGFLRAGGLAQHIERNLDVDRPAATVREPPECPIDRRRQLLRGLDALGLQRKRCNQSLLVGQLMQIAEALAECFAPVDARDDQHRHRLGARLGHCGQRVGQPGAGDDEDDPRLAAHPRIAVGHERCALLVARCDMADGRAGEPAIELDRMNAGDPEHHLDTTRFEQRDQGLAGGRHPAVS